MNARRVPAVSSAPYAVSGVAQAQPDRFSASGHLRLAAAREVKMTFEPGDFRRQAELLKLVLRTQQWEKGA
jgi:hypothetical protein